MKREEIIEELARSRYVERMVANICKTSAPELFDLAQMVYEILLTYDEAKIIDLYRNNQIGFFIVRIIKNQFYSQTSPFYMMFKRSLRRGVALENLKTTAENET